MSDFIEKKGLGRIPGEVDERDKTLRAALELVGAQKTRGMQFWYSPLPRLDQGREGACVGFARTINYNASPGIHHLNNQFAQMLYELARRKYDEWDGEDYEGTSVRAGAKAAQELQLITTYRFSQDIEEILLWLLNHGPVTLGTDWTTEMFNATKENGYFIKPEGQVAGGHSWTLTGIRLLRDAKDYVELTNSWGSDWGYHGKAKMTIDSLKQLIGAEDAAACVSTEV